MDDRLKIVKYINDPVYGGIGITQIEQEIIDTPIFQRLRGLSQLARVNYVFPGAEHSRFVHSLGVLYVVGLMTEHLLKNGHMSEDDVVKMRISALLHDIGHYPLSHLGESVYGYCKDTENANGIVKVGKSQNENSGKHFYDMSASHSKSADHEQLGKYIVTNNSIIRDKLISYNFDPLEIGEIFTGEYGSRNMVYTQLLHSSLDADRLDYLLRDSFQTGVNYGLVDLRYLVRLMMVVKDEEAENNCVLACNKKGRHVVEHFLMSRYFHYSQVVHHKTNTAFEGMIRCLYIKLVQNGKFIFDSLEDIQKHVNDEVFLKFDDSHLETAMESYYHDESDEEYKMLYEMYRDRIRPKVIFELKDLYEKSPGQEYSRLVYILRTEPEKISNCIGTEKWGYQISPIKIERIQGEYPLSDIRNEDHVEDLREAVKLYDIDSGRISYLAEDNLSIINKLANYKSEFIRIFVLEEKSSNYNYDQMHSAIVKMIRI